MQCNDGQAGTRGKGGGSGARGEGRQRADVALRYGEVLHGIAAGHSRNLPP